MTLVCLLSNPLLFVFLAAFAAFAAFATFAAFAASTDFITSSLPVNRH
jgi:hypothetical protein